MAPELNNGTWKRKEVIGDCVLLLGDAKEILSGCAGGNALAPNEARGWAPYPHQVQILTGQTIDALVTDPPYGVLLGETGTGQERERGQTGYTMFSDTPEYIRDTVVPVISAALTFVKRGIVTPGNKNAWFYPKPDDIGVWYNPAGTGRGKWGFILAHMIVYYGPDPNGGKRSTASSVWGLCDSVSDLKNVGHPCPKPLKFTEWMVGKASLDGECVIDPFMGSGTTGVACVKTNRKFVGIEVEHKYFDIACQRIDNAYRQERLFA